MAEEGLYSESGRSIHSADRYLVLVKDQNNVYLREINLLSTTLWMWNLKNFTLLN